MQIGGSEKAQVIVVVDNFPGVDERLIPRWGLSIYLETKNFALLFDTGPNPNILAHNMDILNIDVNKIQCIVISHSHGDHTGGLSFLAKVRPRIPVYIPPNLSLKRFVEKLNLIPVIVNKPTVIDEGIIVINANSNYIWEQFLLVNVSNLGSIILVGCSHPGIEKIVRKAHQITQSNIYAIIGGLHTAGIGDIGRIIASFNKYNISAVFPIHCSGNDVRYVLNQRIGNRYKDGHVGMRVAFSSSGIKIL